jgi:hypothetical protein
MPIVIVNAIDGRSARSTRVGRAAPDFDVKVNRRSPQCHPP